MKRWPLRNRVAFWTACLLTIELIIFGLASGWMVYREQRQTFLEVNTQPTSPSVISEEATELVLQLARAFVAALPVAVLVAAFGVWWITRKARSTAEGGGGRRGTNRRKSAESTVTSAPSSG
jgi:hypothetical protein